MMELWVRRRVVLSLALCLVVVLFGAVVVRTWSSASSDARLTPNPVPSPPTHPTFLFQLEGFPFGSAAPRSATHRALGSCAGRSGLICPRRPRGLLVRFLRPLLLAGRCRPAGREPRAAGSSSMALPIFAPAPRPSVIRTLCHSLSYCRCHDLSPRYLRRRQYRPRTPTI